MLINDNVTVQGSIDSPSPKKSGVAVVASSTINDIVTISQAAYDALGAGRPATRLYVITS
jgi:hypothetical protein